MSHRGQPQPTASSSRPTLKLSRDVLSRFKPAKVFHDAVDNSATNSSGEMPSVVSLAFDDAGEKCVTAGEDESFALWDARQGKKSKTFYSKKYGIGHVRFTHRAGNILHTSTKLDHAVRYHSMHDNKYLSYFRGHTDMVRSIHMNPANDTFVSAGDDRTVRLWDLRSQNCQGLSQDIGGSAIVAFDNTGMAFAIACSQTQTVALYNTAEIDHAPFVHAAVIDHELVNVSIPPPVPIFTSIAFSNDGKYILLGTSSDFHYVLDAWDQLRIVRRLTGHQGLERDINGERGVEPRRGKSGEEVCWTGDSNWVLSGSSDGSICMWDLSPMNGKDKLRPEDIINDQQGDVTMGIGAPIYPPTLEPSVRLNGKGQPTRAVRFNPRLCMLASGGEDLTFWLPEKDEQALIEEGF